MRIAAIMGTNRKGRTREVVERIDGRIDGPHGQAGYERDAG